MLPSRMAETRNAEPEALAYLSDEREQLRDATFWHDDVVVEFQGGDHFQRQRELAAHAPQFLPLRLVPCAKHLGRARRAAGVLDAGGLFLDGFDDAVDFDQQQRRSALWR